MLNELVALETDRNPKLTVLHCAFNRSLKALDVTGNPLLKELVCTETVCRVWMCRIIWN